MADTRTHPQHTAHNTHLDIGLVGDGDEPAVHGGEGGQEVGVEQELEGVEQRREQHDVGERDAVANHERAAQQVALQHRQRTANLATHKSSANQRVSTDCSEGAGAQTGDNTGEQKRDTNT